MADFEITINGNKYGSPGDAFEAVREAWGAFCAANADDRARGDRADYLAWKAANRPTDDEWDGASDEEKALTREVFEANLAAALEAREPVAAE